MVRPLILSLSKDPWFDRLTTSGFLAGSLDSR